jgi:hypothetical protein
MKRKREIGVAVKENATVRRENLAKRKVEENATVRRENLAKRKVEENARLEKDDKQRDNFKNQIKYFI